VALLAHMSLERNVSQSFRLEISETMTCPLNIPDVALFVEISALWPALYSACNKYTRCVIDY
jgi:hypothetical protein